MEGHFPAGLWKLGRPWWGRPRFPSASSGAFDSLEGLAAGGRVRPLRGRLRVREKQPPRTRSLHHTPSLGVTVTLSRCYHEPQNLSPGHPEPSALTHSRCVPTSPSCSRKIAGQGPRTDRDPISHMVATCLGLPLGFPRRRCGEPSEPPCDTGPDALQHFLIGDRRLREVNNLA